MDTISTASMTFDELLRIAEELRHVVMRKTHEHCSILVEQALGVYAKEIKIHMMYGPRSRGPWKNGLTSPTAAAEWLRGAVEELPSYEDPALMAPWFTVPAECTS